MNSVLIFSALNEGGLELSLADGCVLRNLRVNPEGLNETLAVRRQTYDENTGQKNYRNLIEI